MFLAENQRFGYTERDAGMLLAVTVTPVAAQELLDKWVPHWDIKYNSLGAMYVCSITPNNT